jgi:hypothetical protein
VTSTGISSVTPGAPASGDIGIETPGTDGTATATALAEATPIEGGSGTLSAVAPVEKPGADGTATTDATPIGLTPTATTTMLPGQLPATGGETGLGTGWLTVGLVVLLVMSGIAALSKGTSGQRLR